VKKQTQALGPKASAKRKRDAEASNLVSDLPLLKDLPTENRDLDFKR